jgi:hypothetical protein
MSANPRRIAVKFFAQPDSSAPVDLSPFIGVFHRFIQNATLEGLLIDVADYRHVPDGPGVILIGHDVDYGIDLAAGRAGLVTTHKRAAAPPLGTAVRDTLRRALIAVRALEDASELRFATSRLELRFVDALALPNSDASYRAVSEEIESVVAPLFGASGYLLARAGADDPRKALTAVVDAIDAPDAGALLDRIDVANAA